MNNQYFIYLTNSQIINQYNFNLNSNLCVVKGKKMHWSIALTLVHCLATCRFSQRRIEELNTTRTSNNAEYNYHVFMAKEAHENLRLWAIEGYFFQSIYPANGHTFERSSTAMSEIQVAGHFSQ